MHAEIPGWDKEVKRIRDATAKRVEKAEQEAQEQDRADARCENMLSGVMLCVQSYGCRLLCSIMFMFHYCWCTRKLWSSSIMFYNSTSITHNHHNTNNNPYIFLSFSSLHLQ